MCSTRKYVNCWRYYFYRQKRRRPERRVTSTRLLPFIFIASLCRTTSYLFLGQSRLHRDDQCEISNENSADTAAILIYRKAPVTDMDYRGNRIFYAFIFTLLLSFALVSIVLDYNMLNPRNKSALSLSYFQRDTRLKFTSEAKRRSFVFVSGAFLVFMACWNFHDSFVK